MKYIVRLVGIVLTILGWLLLNAEHLPFVYRIFAPTYLRAMSTYTKMHEENFILSEGDIGFSEIAELIKENLEGKGTRDIKQITTKSWHVGVLSTPPGRIADSINVELLFTNGRSTTGDIYDLKSRIEKKYLAPNIFSWRSIIFWLGIVISLVGAFL